MSYQLSRPFLMTALRQAYDDACRRKRKREYVRRFERHREAYLSELCDQLFNRTYQPGVSQCFIISDPKKREVFAAEFRDRIVHHLYYNMVHDMFERTFIYDSYSCIKGRGTHFEIRRLEHHIRSASRNYTVQCYVLKLDIRGYFMHIDRQRLLDIMMDDIHKLSHHVCAEGTKRARWKDIVDIDFVEYLTRVLVMDNPLLRCVRRGKSMDWVGLPREKSLFNSPQHCGLPIGNLTSQLFSNIYLNRLDQYVKRNLRFKHYGRYVDDFFIVSADRKSLLMSVPTIRTFLEEELGLQLHEGKIFLSSVNQGVPFLGAYIKPWRRYCDNRTLDRMRRKLQAVELDDFMRGGIASRLNSYIGVLLHSRSYGMFKRMMLERADFWKQGDFHRNGHRWVFLMLTICMIQCF